jgi:hypothetical protein
MAITACEPSREVPRNHSRRQSGKSEGSGKGCLIEALIELRELGGRLSLVPDELRVVSRVHDHAHDPVRVPQLGALRSLTSHSNIPCHESRTNRDHKEQKGENACRRKYVRERGVACTRGGCAPRSWEAPALR